MNNIEKIEKSIHSYVSNMCLIDDSLVYECLSSVQFMWLSFCFYIEFYGIAFASFHYRKKVIEKPTPHLGLR